METAIKDSLTKLKDFQAAVSGRKLPEYRVEEYDGVFQIQRKKIETTTTGMLWWEKTKKEVVWKYVDRWGNCLWRSWGGHYNNYDQKIKPFIDLKSALAKIDVMIKGGTYHYYNEKK